MAQAQVSVVWSKDVSPVLAGQARETTTLQGTFCFQAIVGLDME
jgi:hypothetical protein